MKYNIKGLIERLSSDNAKKRDWVVPCHSIRFSGGKMGVVMPSLGGDSIKDLFAGTGVLPPVQQDDVLGFSISEVAHTQLCDKMGLPSSYYSRLLQPENIPLWDDTMNHFVSQSHKDFFIRTFVDEGQGGENFLRAFLSDKFKVMDNYDAIMAALDTIKNMGLKGVMVDSCEVTDKRMYVRFVMPEVSVDSPTLLKNYSNPKGGIDVGDGIVSGFVISNSEVGMGQFTISPRAIVKKCKNGLMFPDDAIRKTHLGDKMERGRAINWSLNTQSKERELVVSQIKDAVETFLSPDYLFKKVSELESMAKVKLQYPVDAVMNVAKDFQVGREQEAELLSYFIDSGDMSAFGLVQAVTFLAHETARDDMQWELESKAVSILEGIEKYDRPTSRK